MNDVLKPPAEGHARAGEPEPKHPPSVCEIMLARSAGDVVERCAKQMARKFPRLVRGNGLVSIDDFIAVGHEALYAAARAHREVEHPEFAAFARYYVRAAMLEVIDDLLFEERVSRAAARAGDNYCAFYRDNDYNVMKHDEAEARRRYRAFANGLIAATLAAQIEEAGQCTDADELAARRDFERATRLLRAALARLAEADQRLLALMYRDLMTLKAASTTLGIPYGTARARHSRALGVLHELLVDQDITHAPRPLVVEHVGGVLDAPTGSQNDG